jgi:hypothetical protein
MIRLILVLVLIYALYNFVFKVIVPLAARSMVNKAQRDMQERMQQMQDQQRKPEGEINVSKKSKGNDGEYVDYEEVK